MEKAFFEDVPEEKIEDWQTLYMSLSYFHAIVRERRRYSAIGWNIPYDFNESDFKISIKQLKHTMKTYSEIPFKALHYLTSECYYGGKVTDSMDRRLLIELLKVFYNEEVLKDKYYFSSKEYYYVPREPKDMPEAIEFIKQLPDINEPELYGLHANAAISSAITNSKITVSSILTITSSSSEGIDPVVQNKELKATAKTIFDKIPKLFNVAEVKERNKLSYENCMNTVLLQEILRYNSLLEVIQTTLSTLIQACDGVVVMTNELEHMGF